MVATLIANITVKLHLWHILSTYATYLYITCTHPHIHTPTPTHAHADANALPLNKSNCDCDCECECINRHFLSVISFARTQPHTRRDVGRIGVVWRLRAKSSVSRARLGGSATRRSAARRADATADDVRCVVCRSSALASSSSSSLSSPSASASTSTSFIFRRQSLRCCKFKGNLGDARLTAAEGCVAKNKLHTRARNENACKLRWQPPQRPRKQTYPAPHPLSLCPCPCHCLCLCSCSCCHCLRTHVR